MDFLSHEESMDTTHAVPERNQAIEGVMPAKPMKNRARQYEIPCRQVYYARVAAFINVHEIHAAEVARVFLQINCKANSPFVAGLGQGSHLVRKRGRENVACRFANGIEASLIAHNLNMACP